MTAATHPIAPNHQFGILLSGVFCALAGLAIYRSQSALAGRYLACGTLLALVTWRVPQLLTPFNRAWMTLGDWLGRIMNPIILAIIFWVVVSPLAIVLRIFGRDELRLKKGNRSTYWKPRTSRGPLPESFKHQF